MAREHEERTYAVQAGAFQPAIYAGRINKAGTEFTSKDDVTDDAILAVAQYVLKHFDGGMEMTFTGKGHPSITVTIKASEEASDE